MAKAVALTPPLRFVVAWPRVTGSGAAWSAGVLQWMHHVKQHAGSHSTQRLVGSWLLPWSWRSLGGASSASRRALGGQGLESTAQVHLIGQGLIW